MFVAEPGGTRDGWDERHGAGKDSPAQHDARNPFAGAEPLEQEIRWDFKDEISDEKDAGAEAEGGLRQAKVLVHRERGKAHVYPVEIRDEVTDDEKRYQPLRNFRDGADFNLVHHGARRARSQILFGHFPQRPCANFVSTELICCGAPCALRNVQIEIACPEIVLPRGLHMNRI